MFEIYIRIYRAYILSRGTHADSLHLAMRVREGEGARFFYQTRKASVRARGGIEEYSRLAFFHAVLSPRRNRINQRVREPRAISSKCVWIAMDARIEPVLFAQMGDF